MIDPEHALSISQQAEELEISRSTVYYQPRPVSDADLFRWQPHVARHAQPARS